MLLTPDQREWLVEWREDLRRELNALNHPQPGIINYAERRAELAFELQRINDQLGEEEPAPPRRACRDILSD